MATVPVYGYIVETPGYCGGKPRIDGHRIKVQHVAIWHDQMGMSPEDILRSYPQLSLAKVRAALSYYYDNKEKIDAAIREDEEFIEQLERTTPSKLPSNFLIIDVSSDTTSTRIVHE